MAFEQEVKELIRIYREYYPDDLYHWSENQLKAVLDRTVEFYVGSNPDLTEEDVQNYLKQARIWVFRAKPAIREVPDKSQLRNENPIEQPIDPEEEELHPAVQKYYQWLKRLWGKYSEEDSSHFKIFLTKDPKTGDEITRIEWPEREVLIGEWNWESLTGETFYAGHGPSDWGAHSLEDSKHNWQKKIRETWMQHIPVFSSKIQYVHDPKTNIITATIPSMPEGKNEFGWFVIPKKVGYVRSPESDSPDDYIVVDESTMNAVKENTMDPDMEKLEIWKHAVHTKYPALKGKIRFVSKDQGKHISAEIPGEDRSYGVFNMDTLTGHVLSESKGITKKVFEGFVSELNDIAGIYK